MSAYRICKEDVTALAIPVTECDYCDETTPATHYVTMEIRALGSSCALHGRYCEKHAEEAASRIREGLPEYTEEETLPL